MAKGQPLHAASSLLCFSSFLTFWTAFWRFRRER
jgi:hypothetical protein